jgi:hypothetical protein
LYAPSTSRIQDDPVEVDIRRRYKWNRYFLGINHIFACLRDSQAEHKYQIFTSSHATRENRNDILGKRDSHKNFEMRLAVNPTLENSLPKCVSLL